MTGASREEANARERDGVWISTLLLPGLNLVGWLESPILTQGIFDAIPQAQAIWVWDAHRHRWRFARSGDSVSGDLEHLRTGMGFSMRVGGRDPIQWERRLAMTDSAITSSTTYVSLASGPNLVAWAGWPRSLRALGDDLVSVFRWDARRQDRSAPLVADEDGFTPESMRIARRDAVAMNSAQAGLWRQFVRRWWPEVRVRDRWIEETRYLGDVSAAGQNRVREHAADVEALVGDLVGTGATPQVYGAADFESSAAMHQEGFGTGGSGFCGEADPRENSTQPDLSRRRLDRDGPFCARVLPHFADGQVPGSVLRGRLAGPEGLRSCLDL